MKTFLIFLLVSQVAVAQNKVKPVARTAAKPVATSPPVRKSKAVPPQAKAVAKPQKAMPSTSVVSTEKSEPKESTSVLNKSPKAIFLIKRAKLDADIGEPVLYPFERQMKNVYYDLHGGVLRNE